MRSSTLGNLEKNAVKSRTSFLWVLWGFLLLTTIGLLLSDLDLTETEGRVVGKTEMTKGATDVRLGDLSLWKTLGNGTDIHDGSWLKTGSESGLILKLLSDSTIVISENSQVLISIREDQSNSELMLQLDRGQIAIKNPTNPDKAKGIVVTSINGLEKIDLFGDKISILSNLDGRIDKFLINDIDWSRNGLGQRYKRSDDPNSLSIDRAPVDASSKIQVTNPGLLGDSLFTAALSLRIQPFDFAKNRWYLETLDSLAKEELVFSISGKSKNVNDNRLPVVAAKVASAGDIPRILATATSGATQIRVTFSQMFSDLVKVKNQFFAGFDPILLGGLTEKESGKSAFSPELSNYQFRSIGEAKFPIGVEFDKLSLRKFANRATTLAIPNLSKRNLSYDFCLFSQTTLMDMGRHIQNASQLGLFSCEIASMGLATYYIKSGSVVAASTKRIDQREINIVRNDLKSDLVYYGTFRALIASQDRAKALNKVLKKEKDAEEIYFLRGDQLVAVNQAFLSKNNEVVEFVLKNSVALFRNRVEVLSIK